MNAPLSPEDGRRLQTLFDRAAELPHAEHAAFVERECGSNIALREKLARLLARMSGVDILGRLQPAAHTRVGTQIGPYKLLEKLGEGGMGEVYAAEQREPVVRRVALKIIKPGLDSGPVVARFEAERQALARMSHPNIAQVYDAGTAENGSPYFVMEYVAGDPVTEYCDQRKLSTRGRLEIFLGICEGVQHAHQKGVIHRDLKPSNLLVMEQDGRATAKIIDFGVARATTGRLVERTLQTMLGQIVGTLDYMSPEQADPTSVDIDTRSDVYSLGVVLYQLLSGLLPFEHHLQPDLPLSELQRAIRETDPPTPSTRLRRQRATATALARLHGTDERSLVRQLAGDLDWICLKALEKDPARRYQSPSELADDLRRHLGHHPVLAGRPGRLYRLRKFVRRNRTAVAAGLLVAAGLIAGISGVVSGRVDAIAAEQLARAQQPQVDDYRARRLLARADELWPAHPALHVELEAWLEEARSLLTSLDGYRAALSELRERALEWTPEQRELDRRAYEQAGRLAQLQRAHARNAERVAQGLSGDQLDLALQRIAALEPQIAALEAEAEARRTWSFRSDADQAAHESLAGLIDMLQQVALLAAEDAEGPDEAVASRRHGWSVPKRLAFSATIAERSVDGDAARRAWAEAADAVRASPTYDGFVLKPQMGLLPLGPDPQSELWEFAHLASGEPAQRVDGSLVTSGETGIVLVLIPGGGCRLGAQDEDPQANNYDPIAVKGDAKALHDASFAPFLLSKYEMTRGQWERFAGKQPGAGPLATPDRPISMVTCTECDTITYRLGLVLPDEDRWEHAARAGAHTAWWKGQEQNSLRPIDGAPNGAANLLDVQGDAALSSVMKMGAPVPWSDGFPALAPVGRYPANPFGLHDLLGNVSEWCAASTREEPGAGAPPESQRVARGGSFTTSSDAARSAFRALKNSPDFAFFSLGLRPAMAIE